MPRKPNTQPYIVRKRFPLFSIDHDIDDEIELTTSQARPLMYAGFISELSEPNKTAAKNPATKKSAETKA